MTFNNKDNKMYLKLAELQASFYAELDEQSIEKMIKNEFDINYIAPPNLTGMFRINGMTALHLVQHERRIDIAKLLLHYGADYTMKNSKGLTALHAAMERAYEHETFSLLQATRQFADLILSAHIQDKNFSNPCNNSGISHFHAACTVNNVEAAKFFLDHEVSVDQAVDQNCSTLPGYAALHIAVKFHNLETIKMLLQYNANVHAKNSEGMTPVHICVKDKMEMLDNIKYSRTTYEWVEKKIQVIDDILHLLIEKYSLIDEVGLSHLHISSIMADSSVAQHLLKQDVNVNHSINVNSTIFPGYTALHFATQCNIGTVKLLVAKGANMESKDINGISPLDLYLQRYSMEDVHSLLLSHPVWKDIILVDNKTKLVDLFHELRHSGLYQMSEQNILNIKVPLIPSNSPLWAGYTFLHLIIALSNSNHCIWKETIRECLKKGADVTIKDSFGSTPLHLAIQKEKLYGSKIFFCLWNSCKEIKNLTNQNNLSFLHMICFGEYGSPSFKDHNYAKKLLLKDEQLKKQSHIAYTGPTVHGLIAGSTPLHLAVTGPHAEMTQVLLEHGADVLAVDSQDFTPIHRLIEAPSYRLENIGAALFSSPNLKDAIVNDIGLSHLHVATHLSDMNGVKKLLNRGADINARIDHKLPTGFSILAKYAGFTALHIATYEGSYEIVDFLVRHGADMFAKNAKGLPLLYEILSSIRGVHLRPFTDTLENNYALQRRFSEETGLAMFHVACHKLDVPLMREYLKNSGVNINSQARADSPIWSKFTALHILADKMRLLRWDASCKCISDKNISSDDSLVNGVLRFLLSNGADVTITDTNGKSPIHLFFENMLGTSKKDYTRVSSLLEAHKNFSLNPTDSEDMSHFHIACGMNDFTMVQRFLEQGVIDVNEPNNRGNTPLHLSAGSSVVKFAGPVAQLKTIELLLKHGAKVDVKNNVGNTPLHEASSGRSSVATKVFERLLKAGVNAENVFRSSPLELLCKSTMSSASNFKLFYKSGCHFNAFNPMSNEGFLGLILNSNGQESKRDLIWKTVLSMTEPTKEYEMDRSVIHNVVSLKRAWNVTFSYRKIIEQLMDLGCDIDHKDKNGETALHKAVKFSNKEAVFALIETGADVNVVDRSGRTALAYAFEPYFRSTHSVLDYFEEQILKILLRQVIILQHFHLHVCQINKNVQVEASEITGLRFIKVDKGFFVEFNRASDVKIENSLTLRRFLSEKFISDYPYTSLIDRNAIDKFVSSIDDSEFPNLNPVIKLQLRKVKKRISLVEEATVALRSLLNFSVPDVCSRIIFETLINVDLENLITAAFEDSPTN